MDLAPKGLTRIKQCWTVRCRARGLFITPATLTDSLAGAITIDTAGAQQLALGVMTALFARERTGEGQRVQTSALGAALATAMELTWVAMTGADLPRSGNHHPNIKGPYGVYETANGGSILSQTMQNEAWDALCIFAETFGWRLIHDFKRRGSG